ncbi:MAG: UvrD-helicase domain-containing protein [Candidatus Neptunochlamydia sp.]|nr:UvrD-helicase domain-containing protein [Candidatus Neptunochlamydia sp.]
MKTFDVLDPQTPLLGHHLLEASAGTGKTFAIEHITARLILEHDFALDEILIVTFTRAATRELKTRIRKTLKSKSSSFNLDRALSLIDQAQIYTIHGFCYQMLTEYTFESQLGFALLSEEESDYREILKNHITDFFRTSLNRCEYSTAQLAALPGDKEKLIHKVLSLLEKEGEFPSYPTFKEAYHSYLSVRETLSPIALEQLEFNKIKDQSGNLKPPFDTQWNLLQKEVLSFEEFETLTAEPSLLKHWIPDNLSKKNSLDPTTLYKFRDALIPILEPMSSPLCTLVRIARTVRTTARQALEEKEILAPNDILKKMEECLKIPAFHSKVRSRYRAAIIDEFQDTDPIQWNIFKTLFIDDPIPALYLVGDPKQSIYSFRSADIYTYLSAQESVPQKAHLDTNYRSDPKLIQALNHLFSQNKEFLSLPDAPLLFHPTNYPETEDRAFPDNKDAIHYFIYKTEKKREKTWPSPAIEQSVFFPFIASEIYSLTKYNFNFSDFAILVKDRYQAARLKNYLESQNIPTQSKSTEAVINTPTFNLIRSLLEALIHPMEITVKRFLSFSTTHHEIKNNEKLLTKTLAQFSRPQTLQEALRTFYSPNDLDAHSDYLFLSELLLQHQAKTHATFPELLDFLLIQRELPRQPLSDPNSVTIMTIHMSKGLEFNIVFALGLLNRYTGRKDFIRHQKKWLLFEPKHAKCHIALQNQEAEKLRQLYVALTRAKHRLYIPLLVDTSHSPIPLGQASPLELFKPIPTDATDLSPQKLILPKPQSPTLQPPLPLKQSYPPRFLHSYSSLAQTHHVPQPELIHELPKGPETGIILHSLLETILRNPNIDIPNLLKQELPSHFPYEPTLGLMQNALHTPLAPHSFTIAQVKHCYPEVEFLYPDPPNYIKGYIDLIFFHQNQYFLLDWKTNLLPSYDLSNLQQAMTEHDYHLQSSLYQTALSRYLSQTHTIAPLVGTYYIFLRGLPSAGILYLPNNNG